LGEENHSWLLVRQSARGGKVPPVADKLSGGRHINRSLGEGNRSLLLVRQTTMAIEIIHVVGQANNNENPKPDSGGRHINRTLGEKIHSWLLVRRPTTAREIIHGCWSGGQQRRIIWRGKSYMVVGQAKNKGVRSSKKNRRVIRLWRRDICGNK